MSKRPGPSPRTRRGSPLVRLSIAAAFVAGLLAVTFYLLVRRPAARPAAVAVESAPRAGSGPARGVPAFRTGGEPVMPSVPSVPSGGPGPHFAHYQGRSGRLAEGLTPVTADPVTRIGAPGAEPSLEVWVPSVRVLETGTLVLARLSDTPTAPLQITSAKVGFSARPREVPAATQEMTEVASGPGIHEREASFVPPPTGPESDKAKGAGTRPPRFFRYQVVVTGTRGGAAFERRAGGFFYVHDPGARLDPASAALANVGGDLRLSIQATVKRAGTYFVYAELWGGKDGDRPIAFARDRLTGVTEGQRAIELRFGGRIVRDGGVDGPFVVRNLRLSQVDTHPAHEGDPIRALPKSPPWPARSFQ